MATCDRAAQRQAVGLQEWLRQIDDYEAECLALGNVSKTPFPVQKDLSDARKSPTFVDLTGTRINHLTVVGLRKQGAGAWQHSRGRLWSCRCDCGLYTSHRSAPLKAGTARYCHVCSRYNYILSLSEGERADYFALRGGSPDAPP